MRLYFKISILVLLFTQKCVNANEKLRIAFLPFAGLIDQFLSTVQPNNALNLTKVYIYQYIYNGSSPFTSNNIQGFFIEVWHDYLGYIILVIFALLFIVFFTLVGICFFLCRCCCRKCGVKPPDASTQKTRPKRIVFNILLFTFSVMILIGSTVAMSSNFILLEAFRSSNSSIDKNGNILGNIDTTIDYAISYCEYVINNLFKSLFIVFNNCIDRMLSIFYGTVQRMANIVFDIATFNNIINGTNAMINGYSDLVSQAQNLSNIAESHKNMSDQFDKYLQSLVQNVSELLNDTECLNFTAKCNSIRDALKTLKLGYNISNINYDLDIQSSYLFARYNVSDLEGSRDQVINSSQSIAYQINNTVNGYIQGFINSVNSSLRINDLYNEAASTKNALIGLITRYRDMVYDYVLPNFVSIRDNGIYSYSRIVFYFFIVLIAIVLLIPLLFLVGLCFGICGGPTFEDSACCSRSTGSNFFIGGVAISYIFSWFIMLIVAIMFILGGFMRTEVCRYFTNTSIPHCQETVDEIINATIMTKNWSFKINNVTIGLPGVNYTQSLLNRCPVSSDLISAFLIPPSYLNSISNDIYHQFVSPHLRDIVQKLKDYTFAELKIQPIINITDEVMSILSRYDNDSLDLSLQELQRPILVTNASIFMGLISDLYIVTKTPFPDFASRLNGSVDQFNVFVSSMDAIQSYYYVQRKTFINSIHNNRLRLTTLNDTIKSLTTRTNENKTLEIGNLTSSLTMKISEAVNQLVIDIVLALGDCRGLATTYNSAVGIICTTFLVPFNNLWMGIGWFLLFIIPANIVALKLTQLYRTSHIETYAASNNKAYETSNHFLSENDMEMIRMERPRKI